MLYYCAVKGCGNTVLITKCNPDIGYHSFPKDEERLSKWIDFCGQTKNWKPQKNQGVCSCHFQQSDYDKRYQMRHELIGAKKRRVLLISGKYFSLGNVICDIALFSVIVAIPTMQPTNSLTEVTSLDNDIIMDHNESFHQSRKYTAFYTALYILR